MVLYSQVRASSDELDQALKTQIAAFRDALRSGEDGSGQVNNQYLGD